MRRPMAYLLALWLLALTGCAETPETKPEDTPPTETAPVVEDARPPVAQPETLDGFLAGLTGADIMEVWFADEEAAPSNSEIAAILNAAAANTVAHKTSNDPYMESIWWLDIYLGDSGDDALYLYAGLEEDVVEILGGANVLGNRICVKDRPLYWLVRTAQDPPDGEIDQAAYESYREAVDGYLAGLPQYPNVRRELTAFSQVAESQRLNAQVYAIGCVCIADPPEEPPAGILAGGAFIDSQLRVHEDGNSALNMLVIVDGRVVGFTGWESLEYGSLEQFETKEELIRTVESGMLWF
ncbi:hypothetical protein [uncultured Dysosmobacter sp.]|uniref:hypothetical protein n=1 Tax=uncultured Dysosmobacter sp. TaxID=2591384 RepID=UPI00261086CA|nr:hypothetical protein [uncultured Dysosmobacter sp.]